MGLRTVLSTTAATLLLLGAGVGSAQAGEDTGTGGDTQGAAHANSICVFSGLEDGEEGTPASPGAPPQNWPRPEAERTRGHPAGFQGVRLPARRLLQRSHRLPGRGRRRAVNR